MKKQIFIDREGKKFLQKLFGCTHVMVWKALTFESDSDLARRIRKAALERGGKLSDSNLPDCETFHTDEAMTQVFSPRVKLIAYKKQNITTVLVDGKVKIRRQGLDIPEFMELQKEVQLIASSL